MTVVRATMLVAFTTLAAVMPAWAEQDARVGVRRGIGGKLASSAASPTRGVRPKVRSASAPTGASRALGVRRGIGTPRLVSLAVSAASAAPPPAPTPAPPQPQATPTPPSARMRFLITSVRMVLYADAADAAQLGVGPDQFNQGIPIHPRLSGKPGTRMLFVETSSRKLSDLALHQLRGFGMYDVTPEGFRELWNTFLRLDPSP